MVGKEEPLQKKIKRGRGRGGRGRGGVRGSPVLDTVLRKMGHLENGASLEAVDAILQGKRLSARDYTTVLSTLKKRSAWQLSLRVGEWLRLRARHATETASKPQHAALPNRAHYQVMLSACAASGAAAEALELHEHMRAAGMRVDALSLSTLTFAYERAKQPQQTAELLDQVEAAVAAEQQQQQQGEADAVHPGGRGRGVDPLAFAYTAAIRAHEAAGEWEAALALYDRLEARGVSADAHCYTAALGACRRGGKATHAIAIISKARARPDFAPNGAMYTSAMATCNKVKQWEQSLLLFDDRRANAEDAPLDAYGFSVALGACAIGKQWERALALLEEMEGIPSCRANPFAWNHAIVACNKGGEHLKALELYDRMREGACSLSEHTVTAALLACRENGADWQRAQAIFDGHKEISAQSAMCHAALLDVLAAAEQWQLVLSYFDALKGHGLSPPPTAYERAIEACDRVDPERSLILFGEMRAQHAAPTPWGGGKRGGAGGAD